MIKCIYIMVLTAMIQLFAEKSYPFTQDQFQNNLNRIKQSMVYIQSYSEKVLIKRGAGIIFTEQNWLVSDNNLLIGSDRILVQNHDNFISDHSILGINAEKNILVLGYDAKKQNDLTINRAIFTEKQQGFIYSFNEKDLAFELIDGIIIKNEFPNKEIIQYCFKTNQSVSNTILTGSPVLNEKAELLGMIQVFPNGKGMYFSFISVEEIFNTKLLKYSYDTMMELYSLFEKGKKMYQSQSIENSIDYFLDVIKGDSNYAEAYYYLAKVYFDKNEFNSTIYYCLKVIEKNNLYIRAYNLLGIAYYKTGNYVEAIESVKKAIKLDYNFPNCYNTLGNIYQGLKNDSLAIINYRRTIALNPINPFPYNNLGVIYENQKNYTKAQKCYKKAIEVDSTFSEGWANLGNIYLRNENYHGAVRVLQIALRNGLNHYIVHYNLGVAYYMLEMYSYSIASFARSAHIAPDDAATYYFLSLCYSKTNDGKKSRTNKKLALAIEPTWKKMGRNEILEEIQ